MRIAKDPPADIYVGVKIMHESTAFDMILDEGRTEGKIELLLEQAARALAVPTPRQSRCPQSRIPPNWTASERPCFPRSHGANGLPPSDQELLIFHSYATCPHQRSQSKSRELRVDTY